MLQSQFICDHRDEFTIGRFRFGHRDGVAPGFSQIHSDKFYAKFDGVCRHISEKFIGLRRSNKLAENQTFNSRKFAFKSRKKIHAGFNLQEAIDAFLAAKTVEKRSPKTLKTYRQTLGKFCEWYDGKDYAEPSTEAIRDYIQFLTFDKVKWDDHPTNHSDQVGVSPRSINNIIRVLRIFFNHLISIRVISVNPAAAVSYQKEADDTFSVYSDDDVLALLGAPNQKTFVGFRDYCMMLLLTDTGMRIGEMTSLRICDIDFTLRQVTLPAPITKTNRTRIVPITAKTASALSRLVDYINVEPTDYVFLTSFGERYMADTFAKMLKKYGKQAGIDGVRVSPHTFRHYFAVKYLRSGGDSFSLMRILGHTDIAMTQRYVKYALGDIAESHAKASPVAELLEKGVNKRRGTRMFK